MDDVQLTFLFNRMLESNTPIVFGYEKRHLVDRLINKYKVEVFAEEHPPAHFHVIGPGGNFSYAISDCRLLEGGNDSAIRKTVLQFHAKCIDAIKEKWNKTRPANCQVGPVS